MMFFTIGTEELGMRSYGLEGMTQDGFQTIPTKNGPGKWAGCIRQEQSQWVALMDCRFVNEQSTCLSLWERCPKGGEGVQ